MRWIRLSFGILIGGAVLGWAAPVLAADSTIYVSDKDVAVSDDGTTVEVTAVSSAEQKLTLSAEVPDQDACDVTVSPKKLFPGKVRDVTFTLTGDCQVDEGIELTFTGTNGDQALTTTVKADKAADTPAYWDDLRLGGAIGLVAALVVAGAAWFTGMEGSRGQLGKTLPGLDKAWSFSESWVANVTAVSTAIAAVLFGSDSLESILGEKPTNALAALTASAGIAGLLVALSGIVTLATVAGEREGDAGARGLLTAGGVAGGAFLTLTGTFLVVATASSIALDLLDDVPDVLVWVCIGIVALIVATYGYRTVSELLAIEQVDPPDEGDPTVEALELIAAAIATQGGAGLPMPGAAPAGTPVTVAPRRRRAALL